MKTSIWMLPPLAALALGACSGGAGGGSSSTTPPPVANSNTAPSIAGLAANDSVLQDGSSDPLTFTVSDAQSAASGLNVSVQSSNADLLPAAAVEIGGNDGARTLLLTPEPGKSGTATLTVSVRDPEGLTTTQAMEVAVTAQEQSFRQFAIASLATGEESEPVEVAGHEWTDTAEENPEAFNEALGPVAE